MSGIFLTHLTPLRAAVSLTVVLLTTFFLGTDRALTPGAALLAFATALAARYAFLFASFTRDGIAPRLKARCGSELGFSIYEAATALLVFAQRLAFVRLLLATASAPSADFGTAWASSGALLVVLGVAVSVWATSVIGLDTYHYRDLFMGPRHVSLQLKGPYAVSSNPLYGMGQLAAYGAALLVLSPVGVLAVTLNQVILYAFNALIEQPHLNEAARLSIDTELRDNLSRTMTERGWDSGADHRSLPPRKGRVRARVS
jgi:protein-S-isoprenylcysteine O-methyltransferase Ste14